MSHSRFEYVKQYEQHFDLLKNTYIAIRIDGKGFTKFCESHSFKKPNDINQIKLMLIAALNVMKNYSEIFISYGQSDEFSFILKRSTKLYNRRSEKILTNILSTFTSSYVYYWDKIFKNIKLQYPPTFDARIILYPSFQNIKDYLCWRVTDCHINNLYNTTFWALVDKGNLNKEEAHEKLKKTISSEKNDILFNDFGINYNNENIVFKKGTLILRLKNPKVKNFYKFDDLLIKDDDFCKNLIMGEENNIFAVCHEDVFNNNFWNNEKIDFD